MSALTTVSDSSMGSKAFGLVELDRLYPGLVPSFIVLPVEDLVENWHDLRAAAHTLVAEYCAGTVDDAAYAERSARLVASLSIAGDVVEAALASCGGWGSVSVRTSALAEDGVEHSFAGQYETSLDVPTESRPVRDAIGASVASLFSARVAAYARARRMSSLEIGGSVVVQQMFVGTTSGVLFSENGRGELTLAWSRSARNTTVEGENAHELRASKVSDWPSGLPAPARLLDIAVDSEARLRRPVDIEWAARGSQLALLQVRPQTTVALDYELAWDCTNIAENYPGITLPLTYSFIRGLYSRVYPAFFRKLGVNQKVLDAKQQVFRNTLGYLGGHVYYQIDNWYEMVRLIPGPSSNQAFFSAMLQPQRTPGDAPRRRLGLRGALTMAPLVGRLGVLLLRSNSMSKTFSRTFQKRLKRFEAVDWNTLHADAILSTLETMRAELLTLWATPVFNDLRVMIFHGLLKTYSFSAEQHADYLGYLHGLSDRASIAPLTALGVLGNRLRERHGEAATADGILSSPDWMATRVLVDEYLARFGGRAPDELQLENPRLADDYASLLALALGTDPEGRPPVDASARSITGRFGTRFIGRNTRQAIDWRERFRFNRAQVYGLARAAYLALGQRLVDAELLETANDVFWLTEQELDEAVFGHAWSSDPRSTVARRRAEFGTFEQRSLARRVVGSGLIAPAALRDDEQRSASGMAAGMGVSPGVLTAEAIVVHAFDPTIDVRGKILVTSHIDPGWTLLFVQAAGVVTERGNALSHVAIIARELAMPAVVAAMGAVDTLSTGQVITINGTTGDIDAAL
ncbi:PEP/pyruvate-binding domain-containing protein [Agreia pratensis]|uniref:Pyruvate, water dikinase n=1 Tax=Agreia pratensis TaxID=150121 RepID=A0A1X7JTI0_9MICO|nr:PEP/pyruvate-binding domain-containing protein [Agreia pratensis]SMG30968.1 pyruvate, water dikinase [Agreia pratensis]